jgi:hypothetical protein
MNLKKILILPVGFLFTNIMYLACTICHCEKITNHFYEVVNISAKPIGSKYTPVDDGTPVTVDSIYLDYFLSNNCVVSHKNNFSFLVNTANACSCESCGDQGLKSKITSIEISSDNIYNGIPANTSLNNLFKTYNKYNIYGYSTITIDSMITFLNLNQRWMSELNLYTITKPGNTSGHQINLKATFANGSTFSSKTKAIYWQ